MIDIGTKAKSCFLESLEITEEEKEFRQNCLKCYQVYFKGFFQNYSTTPVCPTTFTSEFSLRRTKTLYFLTFFEAKKQKTFFEAFKSSC